MNFEVNMQYISFPTMQHFIYLFTFYLNSEGEALPLGKGKQAMNSWDDLIKKKQQQQIHTNNKK